jgi:hypothetical protein
LLSNKIKRKEILSVAGNTQSSRAGDKALLQVLCSLGRTETPHGMRSAFFDWCHERSNANHVVIETNLAHLVGTDLFAKRRALMERGPVPGALAERCQRRGDPPTFQGKLIGSGNLECTQHWLHRSR